MRWTFPRVNLRTIDAQVNALVEHLAITGQAKPQRMIILARNTKLTFLLCIGDTIIMHLKRANHTPHVMGMNNSS